MSLQINKVENSPEKKEDADYYNKKNNIGDSAAQKFEFKHNGLDVF